MSPRICIALFALVAVQAKWECGWIDTTNDRKYNLDGLKSVGTLEVPHEPANDPNKYKYSVSICENLATECAVDAGTKGTGFMHQDRVAGSVDPPGCMGWMGVWGADDAKLSYSALTNNKEGFMIETHTGSGSRSCSEDKRKSQLVFECDETVENGDVKLVVTEDESFDDEDPEHRRKCMYKAFIKTKHACAGSKGPGSPGSGGGGSGGLGFGWIFVMAVFIPLTLYCLVGCGIRFHKGQRGKAMLPNAEFWGDLPTLVKDGAGFTKSKVMTLAGKKGDTEYSTMGESA